MQLKEEIRYSDQTSKFEERIMRIYLSPHAHYAVNENELKHKSFRDAHANLGSEKKRKNGERKITFLDNTIFYLLLEKSPCECLFPQLESFFFFFNGPKETKQYLLCLAFDPYEHGINLIWKHFDASENNSLTTNMSSICLISNCSKWVSQF